MLTSLTHRSQYCFTALSQLINQRIPLIDPEDGQKLDHHLNRYRSPIYSAYLYKRRITRDQIYPKIHIIDNIPVEEEPHLKCQTLYPIKNAMDQKTMERLVKEDPSNINSSYVISVFCEDHFKPMIDEYVKKVLVCGKSPKNYQKMNEIEQKIKQLHKIFYYGEPITQLQRQIQLKYLSQKQRKFIMHHDIIKDGQKNDFTRCKWREQDQRILQDMVNWRKTDPEVDDTNFRPFYEPLQLLQRAATIQKFYSYLGVQNWYDRRKFNKQIKIYYEISEKYYGLLADKIYNRINQYINSVEFTNLLKIPPDFMIEMAMYQIHVWMICERLQTLDTRDTRYLANLITQNFKNTLELKAATLNVKKENILVRNLHKMLWQNAGVLRFHFTKSNITKDNPYKGIDALVWSILFFEKVDRYGDQVYLMGEYLIKNYQMIQQYNEQELMNGLIQFDAYVVDPRYKEIIQSINPPLSKEEFQKQFDSDKFEKKYHYNEVQKGVQIPIDAYKNKKEDEMKVTWGEIFSPVRRFFKKYQTLDTMDHYDDIEAQQKRQKQKQQSTLWKSKIDEVEETKKQYQQAKDIRKQMHSQKKRNSWSNLKVGEDSKKQPSSKK